MSIFHAAILGIVQGLTEFLPVSSSGHLMFVQNLMGYEEPMIAFDIVVHLGTLIAILIYFFKDILGMFTDGLGFVFAFPRIKKTNGWNVYFHEHPLAHIFGYTLISTAVTVAIVLIFQELVYGFFTSIKVLGGAWILMGILLIRSRKLPEGTRGFYHMNQKDAYLLGLIQAAAVVPGISRSGATILGGLSFGLERKVAARYSFFMGLFAIAGAGVFELKEGLELLQSHPQMLAAGFLTSAVVGYLAIVILMRIVESGKFYIFGFYCAFMGVVTLGLHVLGIV